MVSMYRNTQIHRLRHSGIDLAKSLYYNATREKLSLLKVLSIREQRQWELLSKWDSAVDAISEATGDLREIKLEVHDYKEKILETGEKTTNEVSFC